MKRNIFVIGRSLEYANWMEGNIVPRMSEADLVLFTGGEDVSPSMYDEPKGKYTYDNRLRDEYEQKEFHRALEMGKKMIGICRGSQFLCVMSGGKLVQHQDNPDYLHYIHMYDGSELLITSTHHQAQWPYNLPEDEYKILGWTEGISDFHLNGAGKELRVPKECEIVLYPKVNALGIQGHPEHMLDKFHAEINYLRQLLDNFMGDKL